MIQMIQRLQTRSRAAGRWVLGVGMFALALGCLPKSAPETEVPEGPSEDAETIDTAVIAAGMAEGADEAAKQAAAREVLQKVKDRDPEEEKKKMARSRAISADARSKLDKGNHSEAVLTAREALKVHEQNVDAMLVIAEVYYKQGKHELVYAVTTSALQVDAKIRAPEESSKAHNLQGFAMLGLGEESKATQAFKKAAEVDENNAAAWNNMGTRYLDAGDAATATSCFKYALELDPRFFKAQLNYGAALRAEGKLAEAETAMRKALELRPNYAEAYFNLGVLYLDADPFPGLDTTQRLNKAIQNLSKYRELAIADVSGRPVAKGPGLGGSGKAPPPRVSKDRADDFIRVAKKGLEREERRLEREKGKPGDAAGEPAGEGPTAPGDGGAPAVGGEPSPAGPDDGAPEQPTPQGPGEPSKPAPQGPGSEPAKPAPQGPGSEPAKPAPQGPGEPAKPAPQGPGSEPAKPAPQGPSTPTPTPAKPAPQGPSTPTPAKPAPQGPSTPTPTPVKPAPQGPSTPTPTPVEPAPTPTPPAAPSPQKPSVQKPQTAAWSGLTTPHRPFEKILRNPASRGTRWAPPTLNPMAGATALPADALSPTPGLGDARGPRPRLLATLDVVARKDPA
jgi:tetratricopeptide (TPR) repeat protein